MFSFFRKKSNIQNYSFLGTDMHSHILPGIDDGARDVETAVELVKKLIDFGYTRLIATPHIMEELHLNTPETIRGALVKLQEALTAEGINIPISAAAEYQIDENFEKIIAADEELLTLDGKRLLVELPQSGEPPQWQHTIFKLQTKGYKIVLAHPERYRYFAGNIERFRQLREGGIELQVNLLSLTNYYGKGPRSMAQNLIKEGIVDYLGTDLHHHKHADTLARLLEQKSVLHLLEKQKWNNVLLENQQV